MTWPAQRIIVIYRASIAPWLEWHTERHLFVTARVTSCDGERDVTYYITKTDYLKAKEVGYFDH